MVVSSESQAETLPHQRAWAEQTCSEKGWHLSRKPFSGVSTGKHGPRRIVREMLAALRATDDRPDWILMIRLDRLGRQRLECEVVLSEIRSLGVRVWTRDGGEERGDSAMEQLISAVKLAVGQHENEVKAEKMRAVYRRRKAAGEPIGNRRPYGLALKNGKTVVVEDQADTVRTIFRLRLEGLGYRGIVERVAPIAAPIHYTDGATRPVRWSQIAVKAMLQQRAYVPHIIDELTFRRAQAMSGRDRAPQKYAYPLSGSVRCWCGYQLQGVTTGQNLADPRRYRCPQRHGGTSARRLEGLFLDLVRDLTRHPEMLAEYRRSRGPSLELLDRSIRDVDVTLAELEKEKTRVWDLNMKGLVEDEQLKPRLDAIEARITQAKTTKEQLQSQRAVAKAEQRASVDAETLLARAPELWERGTAEERRAFARAFALLVGGLVFEPSRQLGIRQVEPPLIRRMVQQ